MNHAGLQRALFRMQLDPTFDRALRDRDRAAERSTGLSPDELACLRASDPRAVAADRHGARRAQFLRNVAEEFALTLTTLPARTLEPFPRSREFHDAVREDRPLPLALGAYLHRETRRDAGVQSRALLELELVLARARRTTRSVCAVSADEVVLAPWAHLVSLPAGTFELAAALREADGSAGVELDARRSERLLVTAAEEPPAFGLRAVRVERLQGPVARFLERARRPVSRAARSAHARREEADPDELEALVCELVEERVLLRGAGPDAAS